VESPFFPECSIVLSSLIEERVCYRCSDASVPHFLPAGIFEGNHVAPKKFKYDSTSITRQHNAQDGCDRRASITRILKMECPLFGSIIAIALRHVCAFFFPEPPPPCSPAIEYIKAIPFCKQNSRQYYHKRNVQHRSGSIWLIIDQGTNLLLFLFNPRLRLTHLPRLIIEQGKKVLPKEV